ncbi:pentapeptide repeat-containing protein [Lentzea flaviverrucosa]|uniref:Pentapeptide repeat-containing protein n=1 Tax=Lentzea flaviverrucosa TaxID=200379 RepID=A0A1H9EVF9_9PSEU|nr:pentapeptide repeat-containing protein [Lentzea flaviverrucosa]RDI35386.1 pentapeptide repeat protein [Lentzea flaviverrucosa]SEQ29567.1 Pentapeptide repeat-containing protein [Lentzea flaviverrucosa]
MSVVTVAVLVVLWRWIDGLALTDPEKRATTQLDALKLAASIVVGGGGLFALYLAARRQHTQELELDARQAELAQRDRIQAHAEQVAETNRLHAERIAADTYADAAARRITELYAKSVEQLGSDKAPVRLGGLYALERLGQDNPDRPALRQTVVDVLCAYLRMPFTLPGDRPSDDADEQVRARYDERTQEREVRLTAQRILAAHLRPDLDFDQQDMTFWLDIDLDLTGATLMDFRLTGCRVRQATFDAVWFVEHASFREAVFEGDGMFDGAVFSDGTSFDGATFHGFAGFVNVQFDNVGFSTAKFSKGAMFGSAVFQRDVRFGDVVFEQTAWFRGARFAGSAQFARVIFGKNADFDGVQFIGDVVLDECAVRHPTPIASRWPDGWRTAEKQAAPGGRSGTWHRVARVDSVDT